MKRIDSRAENRTSVLTTESLDRIHGDPVHEYVGTDEAADDFFHNGFGW